MRARRTNQRRLSLLRAKVRRGDTLTMAERIERQGLIFNHHGNIKLIKLQLA